MIRDTLKYSILFLCLVILNVQAETAKSYYTDAYLKIDSMLTEKTSLNFKQAVFLTENAYFDNHLNQETFNSHIRFCTSICRGIIASGNIIYQENDTERATAQCAVFTFMTDSIPVSTDNGIVIHTPFAYNFVDFAGQKEWSNMFVSSLI